MVDPDEGLEEGLLDAGELAHRQRAVVELVVLHLHVNDVVDELLELGRCELAQGPGRGLHRVSDHRDRRFLGLGAGTGIAVRLLGNLLFRALADRETVEVLHRRRAVVLLDERLDRVGNPIVLGQLDSVLRMGGDDELAHFRAELGVPALGIGGILREVLGLGHLAHVVEVGADAAQQVVGADRLGGRLGEAGHVQRVVIGPRSLHLEPPQERLLVLVGVLQKGDVREAGEQLLKHRQKAHHHDAAEQTVQERQHDAGQRKRGDLLLEQRHRCQNHRLGDAHPQPDEHQSRGLLNPQRIKRPDGRPSKQH